MSGKYYNLKVKVAVIAAHILALMLAVGIICFSFSQCLLVTRDMNQLILINPFDKDREYQETDVFAESFQVDAASLINYLAVCGQFETDGEFDPEKKIDLISFYCRKNPYLKLDSDNSLVYKVQDLITWKEAYGFTSYEDNALKEVFLPVDGVSIAEKEEVIYDLMNAVNSSLDAYSTSSDIEEYYGEDASVDDTTDEFLWDENEEYNTQTAAAKITVEYTDEYEDKDKENTLTISRLGEKSDFPDDLLTWEEAQGLFNDILRSVASDLSYNYAVYQEQKDYFRNSDNNFKYLYIPGTNVVGNFNYYTNLQVESWSAARTKEKYFDDELAAYMIIDVQNGNTEEKSVNVPASNVLYSLNQMKYAFSDGGKLYLGVLDKDVEGFAQYAKGDTYAQIKSLSTNSKMDIKMNVGWVLILILLSLMLLMINTILCGRTKDDKEIHLMTFDYWYTEIALALGLGTAIFLILGLGLLVSILDESSTTFAYQMVHDNYFMMVMVAYVAIADACFLFFYNSLIRRIKEGRLWKGSLTKRVLTGIAHFIMWIVKGIATVFRNANALIKAILTFLAVFVIIMIHFIAGTAESDFLLLLGFFLDCVLFSLILYINLSRNRIIQGIEKISGGELEYQVDIRHMYGDSLRLAEAVNNIGDGIREAVNQSMKDERMKADLITNVSHDIKTPLTSIINYVDLLKRENVQDETIRSYIEVLDNKSQRLKQLTEDLVEASKISSGNIVLNIEELNVVDLMKQALGEFGDKFGEKELRVVESYADTPCIIQADSRRMWRVIDNLLGNVYKYALEKTRVYVEVKDLRDKNRKVSISIKNISKQALNIDADELTERFIRGDISRSTEGSGLGLSIAKNLVEAQGGTFSLYLDGDLFKATIVF